MIKAIKENETIFGMLGLICLVIAIVLFANTEKQEGEILIEPEDSIVEDKDTTILTRQDTLYAMAKAFSIQESNQNPKAISPCGKYAGCLQMSKIMVLEVNRIIGEDAYNYEDRLSRYHSFEMFRIVMEHHNECLDIDRAVDIWNKGAPDSYRTNVKKYFSETLEEQCGI